MFTKTANPIPKPANLPNFDASQLSENDKQILDVYLDLKAQESEIAESLKDIQPSILEIIAGSNKKAVTYKDFQIQMKIRTTYQFSGLAQMLEEELKDLKSYEISKGLAEVVKQTLFTALTKVKKG